MVRKDEAHIHWANTAPAGVVRGSEYTWEDQLRYWREQLAGLTAVRLPGARPGPRDTNDVREWVSCAFEVPGDLINRLACLGGEHDLSSLDISVAALSVVLARYTSREDIAVATVASSATPGRGSVPPDGAEPVNAVVLRARVTGSASLLDLLLRVRGTVTEALAHSLIPFDVLAGELGAGWDLMRAVVTDACTPVPSATDIVVRLHAWRVGVAGVVECRRGAFDVPRAEQLAGHLVRVLGVIAATPDVPLDDIDILPEGERTRLLVEWNDTARIVPGDETAYRAQVAGRSAGPLPTDGSGPNTTASAQSVTARLSRVETQALLRDVPGVYPTRIDDVLLAALDRVLSGWTGQDRVLIDCEGHGREQDLLRAIPRRGAVCQAPVSFSYLGRLGQAVPVGGLIARVSHGLDASADPESTRAHELEIVGWVEDQRLQLTWTYSVNRHNEQTIIRLAGQFLAALGEIIAHCAEPGAGGAGPGGASACHGAGRPPGLGWAYQLAHYPGQFPLG